MFHQKNTQYTVYSSLQYEIVKDGHMFQSEYVMHERTLHQSIKHVVVLLYYTIIVYVHSNSRLLQSMSTVVVAYVSWVDCSHILLVLRLQYIVACVSCTGLLSYVYCSYSHCSM